MACRQAATARARAVVGGAGKKALTAEDDPRTRALAGKTGGRFDRRRITGKDHQVRRAARQVFLPDHRFSYLLLRQRATVTPRQPRFAQAATASFRTWWIRPKASIGSPVISG